jgi:hypothetical protein
MIEDNAQLVFHQSGCQSVHVTREEAFVGIETSTTNSIPAIYMSKSVVFKVHVPMAGFRGDFATSRWSASRLTGSTCTLS